MCLISGSSLATSVFQTKSAPRPTLVLGGRHLRGRGGEEKQPWTPTPGFGNLSKLLKKTIPHLSCGNACVTGLLCQLNEMPFLKYLTLWGDVQANQSLLSFLNSHFFPCGGCFQLKNSSSLFSLSLPSVNTHKAH